MSKTKVIEEMQQIRKLRLLGLDREEIMKQMNLSRHSYENRVKKINMIDNEYIVNRFHNELGTEMMALQERLLSTIRMCESIITSSNNNDDNNKGEQEGLIETETKLEAERLKIDCSIALVKLLNEGPQVLNKTSLGRAIISRESKLLSR